MIYLDNSATTQPLPEVLDTFVKVNELYYANPASIHEAGVESNNLLNSARSQIANILNTEEEHVIFTSGGTESNNFAIFGITKANTHIGKHVITTQIEHPSVLQAMKELENDGFEVEYLKVDKNGVISLDELKEKLRKDTVLVSIMHVNNEIGSVQPIFEAAKIIHKNCRAFFHVDAVQSFGKMPVRFQDTNGPDLISISGHKIHALKGSGVIAFRKKLNIKPYLLGGGQEFGLRSGTVAVPQAAALSKASRIANENLQKAMENYRKWHDELYEFLQKFGDEVFVVSPKDGAGHILSFSIKDLKGEIIINALQKRKIIVSTSSACSSRQKKTSHVVEAINVPSPYKNGVIRISFGSLTTKEHIEKFKQAFSEIMAELKGVKIE